MFTDRLIAIDAFMVSISPARTAGGSLAGAQRVAPPRRVFSLTRWGVWCLTALAALAGAAQAQNTDYVYDAQGRLSTVLSPAAGALRYQYDAAGNVITATRNAPTDLLLIDFSPRAGFAGTTVTLRGSGFLSTPSANTVQFAGTPAAVTSASPTRLTVALPAGATSGPISVGNAHGLAVSALPFEVYTPLAITGFAPQIGAPGSSVTITGQSFDAVAANNQLRFHLTPATVSTASGTSLSTTVPSGATSGRLRLTTRGETVTSEADFFIPPSPHLASDIGATARLMIDGPAATVSLAPGKKALLAFDGAGGQNIGLGSTTLSGNLSFTVYQPNGASLYTTYANQAFSADFPVLPATGTYTLLVQPAGSSSSSVTLALSNDLTGTLPVDGSSQMFSTTRAGQNGRYTFAGSAGQIVGIEIGAVSFANVTVELRQPSGATLVTKTVNSSGGSIAPRALPVTGTYTVFVNPSAASTGSLTLKAGAADLVISNISVGSVTLNANGSFKVPVAYTVTNTGNIAAPAYWYDQAYLSPDATLHDGDAALTGASYRSVALAVGASYTQSVNFTTSNTTAPGAYTLFLKTDGRGPNVGGTATDSGFLTEPNEADNLVALPLTLPNRPDLVLSNPSLGTIAVSAAGAYSLPLSFTVTNAGESAAPPAWYDAAYLSSNGVLDNTSLNLAGYNYQSAALAPGASYTVTRTFGTPTTTSPGAYTVYLKADGHGAYIGGTNTDAGAIAEANESNNTQALAINLPARPDLVLSDFAVGSITKNANGSYTIAASFRVSNQGGIAAPPAWYDAAYLCGNGLLDSASVNLAGYNYNAAALPAGASYTVNRSFTTPTTTPAGNYTLFVKADGHGAQIGGSNTDNGSIAEGNETNNALGVTITLP
ncbi:MAG: IPT/TIG domain-containing protein [Betaproteobacteria bacterium]|nr:IPT/TIG domain-containing protein [Betaproteobacteria bacterium]